MQVNKNNITQFLTSTNMSFMIPVYQRNYDWTEDNCRQLWSDVWYVSQARSRTHFLGTICSKTTNGHEKSIIDGQQRLTTITLMMKAMHDFVDNDEFKRDIDSSFLRNTGYGVSPDHKVKLHLNRRDDAVYNKLLEYSEFTDASQLTPQQIESRVYQNYAFFYNRFEGLDECQVADIRAALDRIVIVDLDVESENPQEIFESLNSTGLDLTDVDLLRNFLLMSLDYSKQVQFYDEYWFKIEENVCAKNMVRFFVDYLVFKRKTSSVTVRGRKAHISEKNLYIAFKDYYSTLSEETDRYSSQPLVTQSILKDMLEHSKVYKRLVFSDNLDLNKLSEIDQIIYSTVYINQSVYARPVFLYIMKHLECGNVSEDQATEMLRACLSLVFRAKVLGCVGFNSQFAGNLLLKLPEEDFSDVVNTFWKGITSGQGNYSFPSNEVFSEALLNKQIFEVLRSRWTKYMLYAIEQNAKAAKGLPRYDDVNITIEHIMPKTLTDKWRDYLGEDADYHDDHLNKLGNLTLTSNNSEMSNNPFDEKKEWYSESSFSMTRSLSNLKEWSIEEIQDRGQILVERCLEVWPMPEEYQPLVQSAPVGKRRSNFKFSMIGLSEGDEVAFYGDPSKVAAVHDDSHVMYLGKVYSLSALALELYGMKPTQALAGPCYFTYDGQRLDDIRKEIEANVY